MDTRREQLLGASTLLVFVLVIAFIALPKKEAPPVQTPSELKLIEQKSVPTFDPSIILSTTTFGNLIPQVETKPVSIGKVTVKTVTITPKPKIEPPAPVATTTPKTIPTQPTSETQAVVQEPVEPKKSTDDFARVRRSLVNILCASNSQSLRGTSGSGVIISSDGIILTVAHVGQVELLAEALGEKTVSCTVRTGDPARSTYKAKLIYISEPWVRQNSTTLISSQPMGTGENDFALLAITGTTNGTALPSSFPAVSISHKPAEVGDAVLVGGYGGQYLTSSQIRGALSPIFTKGSVDAMYTFRSNSEDVLSILGGRAAQIGSSGGMVTDADGKLIGLITTSEISGDFTTRHLRVITPSHIEESFASSMNQSLSSYLGASSASVLISNYKTKVEQLGLFLAQAIGLQ